MSALTVATDLQAQALSVQDKPGVRTGLLRFGHYQFRTDPLPPPGTRERERQLRLYRHNPYSTIFRGAAAGLVKRVQTTPWEIIAKDADRWQTLLMEADFGDWDRFVSKVVSDYLYHDSGAWVELIAPGDPRFAPTGPAVGLAALDSLRVFPTGNPTYPAIYYDIYGAMHQLHRSRVVQLVDNEYSEEALAGYGECAQSRAIAPIRREILINRYVESYLDDKPMPGMMLIKNLSEAEVEAAFRKMETDKSTDDGGEWGRNLRLYALDTAEEADIKMIANSKAPEDFDFEKYKAGLVKEMALAIGLDIQDIWELSGSGIGTGTQSEVLAQKSRGKAFGNLLKRLERLINRALPERVEFRWQYRDPQEDQEEADKAQAWAGTITTLAAYLSTDEIRRLAANQIGALKDVLIDANGNLRRLNDADPEPGQTAEDTDTLTGVLETYVQDGSAEPTLTETLEAFTQRSFTGTGVEFERYFRAFARVGQAQSFPASMMRATFREELYNAGLRAYEDGLREGGTNPADADAIAQAARQWKVTEWLALQTPYVNQLIDDLNGGAVTKEQVRVRSELWVSKSLRAIFYAGLHDAAGEQLYRWDLGTTEEHCKTCLTLNGQVHRLKEYLAAGLTPGAQSLECKGFNCDCRLSASTEKTRGRLPGVSGGVFADFTDRLGGFLRRLAGKSIDPVDPPSPAPDIWARYLTRCGEGC